MSNQVARNQRAVRRFGLRALALSVIIVSAIGGSSHEDCAIARSAWHDVNLLGRMSDEDYSFEVMHSLASKANQHDLTST
jgi:hypothetical protein